MRTLSAALLAAQQAASGEPYVQVLLSDRDAGVWRLRWERWYSGAEAAGPCRVASPADGSLLRARIDAATGTLYVQRVSTPTAGSNYGSWSGLGPVTAGAQLGLAASGSRALIAYVTGGTSVRVRESTNSGASYGGSTAVATAPSAVTAVACTLQGDGTAVVLYAAGGVVYRVARSGLGAWGSAASWSNSLASVNGLAAFFDLDHAVVVSGVDSAGVAGAWGTTYGAGGAAPPGSWTGLVAITEAAAGTDVTYLATGAAIAEVPRAALVESYAGGGAYDRVQLADGRAASSWAAQEWREPRPFGSELAHGLGLWGDATEAWLASPDGVWHADLFQLAASIDLSADVLEAELEQSIDGTGRAHLVLRNDDGRYNVDAAPAALAPGGELALSPGYLLSGSPAVSEGPTFWIESVERTRGGGRSVLEVRAVDGWGLLDGWTAPKQYVWPAGSAVAHDILDWLFRLVGLRSSFAGGSEAGTVEPGFTVRAGESAGAAVRRLLAALPEVLLMRGTIGQLSMVTESDAVEYAYGTDHALTGLRIAEGRPSAGWSRVFGDSLVAEAVDSDVLLAGGSSVLVVDDSLSMQARADVRAASALRKRALAVYRGELQIPPNVGQEPGDVVSVTDAALGLEAEPFRVGALRWRFSRERTPRFEMTLRLVSR